MAAAVLSAAGAAAGALAAGLDALLDAAGALEDDCEPLHPANATTAAKAAAAKSAVIFLLVISLSFGRFFHLCLFYASSQITIIRYF